MEHDATPPSSDERSLHDTDPGHPTAAERTFDDLDELQQLEPGRKLRLHRSWPTFCEGYLGEVEIPEEGVGALLSLVQASWGGGRFRVQAVGPQSGGGRRLFAKGCASFKIAGNPRQNGTEFTPDGRAVQPQAVPVSAPHPVMMPTPVAPQNPMNDRALSIMETALHNAVGAAQGGNGGDLAGIVAAVKAMRDMVPQEKPTDPYSQLRGLLGLLDEVKDLRGDTEPSSASGGLLGGLGGGALEQALLTKLMGGGENRPPQPQFVPGQYPGYPGPVPQPYPGAMGQSGAPGYAGVPPQGYPQGAQPYAHPPQYPQQPQPPQPQAAHPAPPAQPPPNAQPATEPDDDDEYEPIEPADVVAEIKSRDEKGQLEFLNGVLEGLGMPGGLSGAMEMAGAGAATHKNPHYPDRDST